MFYGLQIEWGEYIYLKWKHKFHNKFMIKL